MLLIKILVAISWISLGVETIVYNRKRLRIFHYLFSVSCVPLAASWFLVSAYGLEGLPTKIASYAFLVPAALALALWWRQANTDETATTQPGTRTETAPAGRKRIQRGGGGRRR